MDWSKIQKYADKLVSLSFADITHIATAWGYDIVTYISGLPDDDKGSTQMSKSLYISRRKKCDACPLQTRGGWCDPSSQRTHVSLKNADGTPLTVNGCGCKLSAKQKSIKDNCPAGEW